MPERIEDETTKHKYKLQSRDLLFINEVLQRINDSYAGRIYELPTEHLTDMLDLSQSLYEKAQFEGDSSITTLDQKVVLSLAKIHDLEKVLLERAMEQSTDEISETKVLVTAISAYVVEFHLPTDTHEAINEYVFRSSDEAHYVKAVDVLSSLLFGLGNTDRSSYEVIMQIEPWVMNSIEKFSTMSRLTDLVLKVGNNQVHFYDHLPALKDLKTMH